MIKRLALLGFVIFNCLFISVPATVQAADPAPGGCDTSSSFLGFPTWYKYLEVGGPEAPAGDPCAITGPTYEGGENDGNLNWPVVVGRVAIAIVEIMLRIAAIVTVGYVTYGGFRYITSQGDPESAKSARQTIQNALIGLVVSLVAIGAVTFIGSQFI